MSHSRTHSAHAPHTRSHTRSHQIQATCIGHLNPSREFYSARSMWSSGCWPHSRTRTATKPDYEQSWVANVTGCASLIEIGWMFEPQAYTSTYVCVCACVCVKVREWFWLQFATEYDAKWSGGTVTHFFKLLTALSDWCLWVRAGSFPLKYELSNSARLHCENASLTPSGDNVVWDQISTEDYFLCTQIKLGQARQLDVWWDCRSVAIVSVFAQEDSRKYTCHSQMNYAVLVVFNEAIRNTKTSHPSWSSGLSVCHRKDQNFESQSCRSFWWHTTNRCRPTRYHT